MRQVRPPTGPDVLQKSEKTRIVPQMYQKSGKRKPNDTITSMKTKKLTLWQKIKLYFHYCPCGGKVWCWELGVYKCTKCTKTYYT